MALLADDVARFRPDDPVDPHPPFVVCHCRPCDTAWLVHLDGLQHMRIRLAPPPELATR